MKPRAGLVNRWLPRLLFIGMLSAVVAFPVLVVRLHYFGSRVREVRFSPGGDRVYGSGMTYLPGRAWGGVTGEVIAWDSGTGEILWRRALPSRPGGVAPSPDGKSVLVVGPTEGTGYSQDFHVRAAATGDLLRAFRRDAEYGAVSAFFLPGASRTAACVYPDGIQFWDLASGTRAGFLPHADARIEMAAPHPDGRSLIVSVAGGYSVRDPRARVAGSLQAWDRKDGSVLRTFAKGDGRFVFALSEDGERLAFFTGDRIVVKEYATGSRIAALPARGLPVQRLQFVRGGDAVVVTSSGGAVTLWDWKRNATLRAAGMDDAVLGALSPDGSMIAVLGRGNGLHREPLVSLRAVSDGRTVRMLDGLAGW